MINLPKNPRSLSPSQQGIFSQTEIGFASEKTKRVSLPRLSSVPAIPSGIATARPLATASKPAPRMIVAPLRQQSKRQGERYTKSQQLLSSERLDRDIQACPILREFASEQQSPKKLTERLRQVERARIVAGEVKLATKLVKTSFSKYNELYRLRTAKSAQLNELNLVAQTLTPDLESEKFRTEAATQMEAELEETIQGLRNELHYQETLECMLETRKVSLRAKKKPVSFLKLDISQLNSDIALATKETLKAERALGETLNQLAALQDTVAQRRSEHTQEINEELSLFKDKQKLLLFLKQEQEVSAKLKRKGELRELVAEKEKRIALMLGRDYAEYAKDMEAAKSIEQHRVHEERKFKEIQSTTSITSIVDMEPYWKYLNENRERLEEEVATVQRQISDLVREREAAKDELKNMYYDGEDSILSPEEMTYMEEMLKVKIEELDANEHNLQRLQDLIAGVTNSISLIAWQLLPEEKALEVKPSSSVECLLQCCQELEGLLELDVERAAEQVPAVQQDVRSD